MNTERVVRKTPDILKISKSEINKHTPKTRGGELSMEAGGNFYKRFAVLEKGCLDFYHKEQDFIAHESPINKKPIKLWTYVLETDSRKFSKSVTSIQNRLKSALMGNDDFRVADLM